MSGEANEGQGFWNVVIFIYGIGSCISFFVFSYQYARAHGFASWLVFGDIVSGLQSLIWPIYLFR
jgi:hypothetical protein